jgi:hypothetical protein
VVYQGGNAEARMERHRKFRHGDEGTVQVETQHRQYRMEDRSVRIRTVWGGSSEDEYLKPPKSGAIATVEEKA